MWSYGENLRKVILASGRGKERIIMTKYTESVLYSKGLLCRRKTLPDFYPTWRKGTLPAAALGSCSVLSSRRKVLRNTCDAYMPGTQTNKRLRFNHDYGILPLAHTLPEQKQGSATRIDYS